MMDIIVHCWRWICTKSHLSYAGYGHDRKSNEFPPPACFLRVGVPVTWRSSKGGLFYILNVGHDARGIAQSEAARYSSSLSITFSASSFSTTKCSCPVIGLGRFAGLIV